VVIGFFILATPAVVLELLVWGFQLTRLASGFLAWLWGSANPMIAVAELGPLFYR
jgi:hypothetical protein